MRLLKIIGLLITSVLAIAYDFVVILIASLVLAFFVHIFAGVMYFVIMLVTRPAYARFHIKFVQNNAPR